MKKKDIVIIGPYLPGKLYGGPVKSILNVVGTLNDNYNFKVITNDRDLNSQEVYEDVEINAWNLIGGANVFYVPKGKEIKTISRLLKSIDYDLIYINSFFSLPSVIIQMMKFLKIINKPVIVAPRGEFSQGALTIKSAKKNYYLKLYKMLKVYKNITFTCTSQNDKKDIINIFGTGISIEIAGNIVKSESNLSNHIQEKVPGQLKIATLSRISTIKNLDYSLRILKKIASTEKSFNEIVFDIYGPIEDEVYWEKCLSIIKEIDAKISIRYKGMLEYNNVINTLSEYHVFLFPTGGENFGHVIQEALLAGCPVIISDQTPWRNLMQLDVGFDIPLSNHQLFIDSIKHYLYMDQENYKIASFKAQEYGISRIENQLSIEEHREMFNGEILS